MSITRTDFGKVCQAARDDIQVLAKPSSLSCEVVKIALNSRIPELALVLPKTACPVLPSSWLSDSEFSAHNDSAYLEIRLERLDGNVDLLVGKLWKFVQAVEKRSDFCSKKVKLLREVFWVKLFNDNRPSNMSMVHFAQPTRKEMFGHLAWRCFGLGLVLHLARKEVCCVLAK
jgi:hypothetical protein